MYSTEGLLVPFQSFMINYADFCHCAHISYTDWENISINRFSIIKRMRNILQEMNSSNGSPNNQNNCHHLNHNSKGSKHNWCLCVSWQIEKHWTLTQLPRTPEEPLEELNTEIKQWFKYWTFILSFSKAIVQKIWNIVHDSHGLLVWCFYVLFGAWQAHQDV